MPILRISLFEGRSNEQKADLVRALTDTICSTLACPPGNVRITIEDMKKHDYFVGGLSVDEMERRGTWAQKAAD